MPSTKAWLPWLLLLVGLIVGGAVATLVIIFVLPRTVTPNNLALPTTNVNTVSDVPPVLPAVPTTWKTYTSTVYGLSFSYPPEWGAPKTSILKAGEGEGFFDLAAESARFTAPNKSGFRDFDVATVKTLKASSMNLTSDVAALDKVYTSKSAASLTTPVVLPPENAAVVASSIPQYIQSADGAYRGVYYYTFLTQNDSQASATKKLTDLYIILTNQTNVVRFNVSLGTTYDPATQKIGYNGTYGDAESCYVDPLQSKGPAMCKVAQELISEFEDTYSGVVGTLK